MGEPATAKRRIKGLLSEADLRPDFSGLPREADQTWKDLIAAAWDMAIVEITLVNLREPLARIPGSLEALGGTVAAVNEEGTLAIVEKEVHTGIEYFTEIIDEMTRAREQMEQVAHQVWKRRQALQSEQTTR